MTDSLLRNVPSTFLGAVQGIAALEVRIAEMRSWPGDFTPEIAAADAFLRSIRETFGVPEMTEAEIDAAHEHAVAAMDALIATEPLPDIPMAIIYMPHNATFADYESRADEYRTRGA